MVASLLSLAFLLKPKNNNINDNQLEEIKTIEQQVVEVLSIEETDKNVNFLTLFFIYNFFNFII